MHKVMYTNASQYVSRRDGVFYYIRRVPHDVRQHYASSRISFSLRTKSLRSAARTASSVTQRFEDYWLGLRLQQMDIPAIHLVKADDVEDNSPLLLDAVEMYLNTKGKTDKTFIRTATRNAAYVAKVRFFIQRLLQNPLVRAILFRGLWRLIRLLIFRR